MGKKAAIAAGLIALTAVAPPIGFAAVVGISATYGYNKYKVGKQQSVPASREATARSKPPTTNRDKTYARQQSKAQNMNIGSLKPTPVPKKNIPSQGMGK